MTYTDLQHALDKANTLIAMLQAEVLILKARLVDTQIGKNYSEPKL